MIEISGDRGRRRSRSGAIRNGAGLEASETPMSRKKRPRFGENTKRGTNRTPDKVLYRLAFLIGADVSARFVWEIGPVNGTGFSENESRKENVYSVSWVAFFMFLVFAMIKIDYQVGLAMNGMDSPYHYRVS